MFINRIIKSWSTERLIQQIKTVESFPIENRKQHELDQMKSELKLREENNRVDYQYYKIVKLKPNGDKIGYYNSEIDPEDSWPTKDVDQAQILTKIEAESVMFYEKLKKQRFNTDYVVQMVGVY